MQITIAYFVMPLMPFFVLFIISSSRFDLILSEDELGDVLEVFSVLDMSGEFGDCLALIPLVLQG